MNTWPRWVLGALMATLLGCTQHGAPPPPSSPQASTVCDLDGMTLADFPGPKAQIFYAHTAQPLFLCNTVELVALYRHPEQVRQVRALYVQDMAATSWDAPVGHWIDARQAWYVQGSRKLGSMGPTLASFSSAAAASAFARREGGRVYDFASIPESSTILDGGVLKDRMEK